MIRKPNDTIQHMPTAVGNLVWEMGLEQQDIASESCNYMFLAQFSHNEPFLGISVKCIKPKYDLVRYIIDSDLADCCDT